MRGLSPARDLTEASEATRPNPNGVMPTKAVTHLRKGDFVGWEIGRIDGWLREHLTGRVPPSQEARSESGPPRRLREEAATRSSSKME